MADKIVTVRITRVERVGTSVNGNPTYDLHVEGGAVYRTETDGAVGYEATNYAPSWRDRDAGKIPPPVDLVLTWQGRVRHIRPGD